MSTNPGLGSQRARERHRQMLARVSKQLRRRSWAAPRNASITRRLAMEIARGDITAAEAPAAFWPQIRLRRSMDTVAAEDLKPGNQKSVSSNGLRLVIYTIVLGVVGALGGLLIDWPLFTGFHTISAVWINLTAFLFPLGYIIITRMLEMTRSPDLIGLLLGLFYGSVLWLQVMLEVFLRTNLEEAKKWDYLQAHFYDVFAVAAIVGAVGYFSADERCTVRMGSLATVFALTGVITGFTEAEVLWANNAIPGYPYWVLPILWALTGIWFGLCVGYVAPNTQLAKVLRGEQASVGTRRSPRQRQPHRASE